MGAAVRVAFVLGTTSGGTGRHVRMLAEGLVRRGHQVLVAGPRSVEEAFAFTEVGARFAELPVADRPHPVNDLRALAALRRLTRSADVIHAHGLRAGALAGLAGLGKRRTPTTLPTGTTSAPEAETGTVPGIATGESGGEGSRTRPTAPGTGRAEGPRTRATGPGTGRAAEGAGGVSGADERLVRAGVAGGGRRVPLVVTLHNALTAGGAVGAVYAVLERIVARLADRVLVVSPDLGERMRHLGAAHVDAAVVPAPDLRPATRTADQVRAELGAGERPVLLTVARLAQQKGLEMLLDVAAGPWQEEPMKPADPRQESAASAGLWHESGEARGPGTTGPLQGSAGSAGSGSTGPGREPVGAGGGERDVVGAGGAGQEGMAVERVGVGSGGPVFVVAGDGPLRGELQARIDAEALPVTLLGNRDDVPDLLAAATAVVWPSRWEGQPLSLSEALKAGRPVIATAVGGIPELVGDAALLVPFGDVAAMRAAVQEVLVPERAAALALASAKRGAELPTAEDAVEAVLLAYASSGVRSGVYGIGQEGQDD